MSKVRYTRQELNQKFGKKQNAELDRLLKKGVVPDEQLDLSDIPEVTNLAALYRPVKQQTSIRLDADILLWLKSKGKGYQTRINQILREEMIKEVKNSL